ncbi:MAG: ANTAR domain-containing protein [Eubacteriales bacterium]|nr:ANTAR domain-containing protein [Eubacteriales bacterium]
MEQVLVVCGTEKGRDMLRTLLCDAACPPSAFAENAGQARRLLTQCEYDLVVINAPLTDEFGHELACQAVENSATGVILLVRNEMADEVAERVEDDGVLVVPKPVSRPMFYQAVRMVAAAQRRMRGLHRENLKLQSKIEEIRLVDRAKLILMEHLGMTEQQAHRYLEKQAMDLRVTRREVALGVLKTYE